MKTIIKNMVLGCFALSLLPAITACSGDELPQPMKKPRTMLTLTTDWTGVDKGEKPNSYVVNINENQYTVENGDNVYELKTNESYAISSYTFAENITITDSIAKVGTSKTEVSSPTAINGLPGTLYGTYSRIDNLEGATSSLSLKMKQLTHDLNVTISNDVSVNSGYAVLNGVASSVNLKTGESSGSEDAVTEVRIATNAKGEQEITVPFRLLGLDKSTTHTLTIYLSLADGTSKTIVTDLSSYLSNFGQTTAPLNIASGVALSSIMSGVNNWQVVNAGTIKL